MPPYGDGNWGLFNIMADPGETENLLPENRALFADLYNEYRLYTSQVGVLDMPPNFDFTKQVTKATQDAILSRNQNKIRVVGLLLLALVFIVFWRFRKFFFRRKIHGPR